MNLNTQLQATVEKYGLADVLAALAHRVNELKNNTRSQLSKARLADVAANLNHSSNLATSAEITQAFEDLYGKPKVVLCVYDYSRDEANPRFTTTLRTADEPGDILKNKEFPTQADVDDYHRELVTRYEVTEVVPMEWFPEGYFQPVPDDE